MLASTALVLVLSVDRIRRSLLPLRELQQGTRRIADRDFGSRVSIRSRDEFEELGASFNAMAAQLDRQFQALATAAEIDRAVLSATSASEIVATLLARLPDVYPCAAVSVTLMAPDGAKSLPSLIHDYTDASRVHVRVDLRSDDVQELLDGPDATALDAGRGRPGPALRGTADGAGPPHVLRPSAPFPGPPGRRHRAGGPGRGDGRCATRGCRSGGSRTRRRWRWRTRGCWSRCGAWPTTTASPACPTGSPTRSAWRTRWRTRAAPGRLVAAFFIDLDHFSRINDTLGHEAGDQLLQQVAARLRSSCRERADEVGPATDALDPEVARLGGDEFTVIMPGLADPEDAGKLARRILSSLAHPFRIEGHEIFVNASIGIAVYPFDGKDLESLLMHADTAMYKAKEQGGNSYQAYSRSMNATALQRLTLENSLRRALEREEFEVHYQPIVDAAERVAGRRRGAGALAPSRARPAAARRVHRAGGRERPDRAAGRVGDADRVRPEPRLAAGRD